MAAEQMAHLGQRVHALAADRDRILIGIAGGPGSGKTTLALQLVAELNRHRRSGEPPIAVHVPMDGYHLANATLARTGLGHRKGAIETFDGWGYLALLRRLLDERDHVVYAPQFDRTIDEGVAGHIAVEPGTRIVVTEGNYLLVQEGPWREVRPLLTEAWFCETPAHDRRSRLLSRHVSFGRTHEEATAHVTAIDEVNGQMIDGTRGIADLVVSGVTGEVLG